MFYRIVSAKTLLDYIYDWVAIQIVRGHPRNILHNDVIWFEFLDIFDELKEKPVSGVINETVSEILAITIFSLTNQIHYLRSAD